MRASYLGEAAGESFCGLRGLYMMLLTHPWCALVSSEPGCSGSNPCCTAESPGFLPAHLHFFNCLMGAHMRAQLLGLPQGLNAFKPFRKVPWWGLYVPSTIIF